MEEDSLYYMNNYYTYFFYIHYMSQQPGDIPDMECSRRQWKSSKELLSPVVSLLLSPTVSCYINIQSHLSV